MNYQHLITPKLETCIALLASRPAARLFEAVMARLAAATEEWVELDTIELAKAAGALADFPNETVARYWVEGVLRQLQHLEHRVDGVSKPLFGVVPDDGERLPFTGEPVTITLALGGLDRG